MEVTIKEALQQGIAAHKEGKLQDAERIYRAILNSQPKHPEANHNLGVLAVSVNKSDAALPFFKAALESNPNIEQFWLSYIDYFIKKQQFDSAKDIIKQAKKQGVVGDKLNLLEVQLTSMNEPENIVSLSPSKEQISNLLEHYQNRLFSDAEKLAVSMTQEFPRHNFSWKILAAVFKATGRYSEAINVSQTAVALGPQDAEAHYNLGNTLKELGRLNEAEASYKQAIALKANFAKAHHNLGTTIEGLGRLNEAEASFIQAIALKPDYAEAHCNLGITLKKLGKLTESEASYKQAIALKPDYAEAHYNLGVMIEELGRLNKAEANYKRAIALNPDYAEAHANLGKILLELGRHREGLNEISIGEGFITFDLKAGLSI